MIRDCCPSWEGIGRCCSGAAIGSSCTVPGKWVVTSSAFGFDFASAFCCKPGECALGGRVMLHWHLEKPFRYDLGVNQSGAEQRCHEVLIFFAEGTQLRDAQVLLVEAPSGVLRLAGGCGGVRVLDFDQPAAPAMRQDGSLQVYPVDAEAVLLLERRP